MGLKNNLPEGFLDFLLRVKEKHQLEWVKVYGSRVRGDHSLRSDIDIAIKSKKLDFLNFCKIMDEIDQNSLTLLRVDLVHFDKIKDNKFKERIALEGVLVE